MNPRRSESTLIAVMIVAFVVLAAWIFYTFSDTSEFYPPRSSYSPRPDGCMALYELLEQLDRPVARFGGTEYHYPADGCVLLVDPGFADTGMLMFQTLNAKQVAGWIRQGGRLVLASEADALTFGYRLSRELDGLDGGNLFDLEPDVPTSAEEELEYAGEIIAAETGAGEPGSATAMLREYMPGTQYELPADRPEFWRDVERLETVETRYYSGGSGTVILGSDPDDSPVVVFRRAGAGELLWITRPELLSNGWLDRAGNHRAVLALLDYAARGQTVYFDEHIHGYLAESYNAGSIITQTTGGRLLLLFGVAVLLLFSGAAVRPARFFPQPPPPRRQASEMVLAQADLYRRAGLTSSIGRLLLDGLKRHYMRSLHASVPPSDEALVQALDQSGAFDAPGGRFLRTCLATGVMPASPAGLLKLAQGCYGAQAKS